LPARDGSLILLSAIPTPLSTTLFPYTTLIRSTVAINENSANGTPVYNVNDANSGADTDAEGQALTYTITGGNALGGFAINAATGQITVANASVLDFETTPSFVLTRSEDRRAGNETAAISITLNNLKDGHPLLNDATDALHRNSASGTPVYNVNDATSGADTDAEGQALTYTITGGNALGGFAINAATGQITVANASVLDFETTPSFVLT